MDMGRNESPKLVVKARQPLDISPHRYMISPGPEVRMGALVSTPLNDGSIEDFGLGQIKKVLQFPKTRPIQLTSH